MNDQPGETPPSGRDLAMRLKWPRLSGRTSAAGLVVCFVLTALLIPMLFSLPRWIEYEAVLGAWWAIWLVVLARLLFTGQRITDDHQLQGPRNWFVSKKAAAADKAKTAPARADPSSSRGGDALFWGLTILGEDAALIVVALVMLVGGIWLLVEVAIPLVIFVLYFVARGMLARVVNDRHHCRGRLDKSLCWALVWATVYMAPLAGAVWFVHFVHRSRSGI